MPSTSPPDHRTFSADTLELAMSAAVTEFGPGLIVLHAQKVRGGLRGMLGRARYEVMASPGSEVHPEGQPVEVTASQEAGAHASLPPRNSQSHQVSVPPTETFSAVPAPAAQPRSLAAEPLKRQLPDQPVAGPMIAERAQGHVLDALLSPPADQLPEAVRRRTPTPRASRTAPGWSRVELHRLGVPDAILSALPEEDPTDDLGWLVALTEAIASVVPPPAFPSPEEPAVLSGWGIKGAVALLEDGARGWPVGTLSDVGRSEPATAVELALAIRRHVLTG